MKYTATNYLPYTQAKRALVLSSGCNLHIWDTDYFRLIRRQYILTYHLTGTTRALIVVTSTFGWKYLD